MVRGAVSRTSPVASLFALQLLFAVRAVAAETDDVPPPGFHVGIGGGVAGGLVGATELGSYDLPASGITTAVVGSLRFRLANGFTFEPAVSASSGRTRLIVSPPSGQTDTNEGLTFDAVSIGLSARPRLARRGRNELSAIAGLAAERWWMSQSNSTGDDDPERVAVVYSHVYADAGIAIQRWLDESLALSGEVYAPLVSYSASSWEYEGETRHANGFLFVVEPTARLMLHLYW
jgi:hypothetical protein